jgi:hypothetical protein
VELLIEAVDYYHSTSPRPEQREVCHIGKNSTGWVCPVGGRIKAKRLASGAGEEGEHRRLCDDCLEELGPHTFRGRGHQACTRCGHLAMAPVHLGRG